MRYRLSPNGNFSKHLIRLVRSINDDIALSLIRACRDPESGIHEARKGCKEIRALLRLLKPNMERSEFSARHAFYRDVSARLSGNRDAMVRQKTWEHLVSGTTALQDKTADTVARFLSSQAELSPLNEKGREYFLDLALEVESESPVLGNWNRPESSSELLPNIKKIYQKARNAEKQAEESDATEQFHSFRKRTKDLYYCLRVLKPVLGKRVKPIVSDLKAVAETQGVANDHAVLLHYLGEHRQSLALDDTEWDQVNDLIRQKLRALQSASHKKAKKILSESPAVFIKRLQN